MADTADRSFHFESESTVEDDNKVTTVRCHGRLVNRRLCELREFVKALIPQGGIIRLDLTDVDFMDSLGLGTLVALKVSASIRATALWSCST